MKETFLRVRYLELTQAPAPTPLRVGAERVSLEKPTANEYMDLYERVGGPVRWDQRLKMPRHELMRLLESESSRIYVLRDGQGEAVGFCEFECSLPDIELKNFGLVPAAQGRRLGLWLLLTALHHEWKLQPGRIWLHTDDWDHPAALRLYENAGFRVYRVREEPPGGL